MGGFENLTVESGTFALCTPCIHQLCTGSSFVLVCKCESCGHGVCEKCLRDVSGIRCCQEPSHELGANPVET